MDPNDPVAFDLDDLDPVPCFVSASRGRLGLSVGACTVLRFATNRAAGRAGALCRASLTTHRPPGQQLSIITNPRPPRVVRPIFTVNVAGLPGRSSAAWWSEGGQFQFFQRRALLVAGIELARVPQPGGGVDHTLHRPGVEREGDTGSTCTSNLRPGVCPWSSD